jgi:mRNA-degrading endonuclease RelE of RelBE toxin-antitoxin system
MGEYAVVFARWARRELEKLPNQVGDRILSRIELLSTNPRPNGCRKIEAPTAFGAFVSAIIE